MSKNDLVISLLDRVKEKTSSDYKTAQALGVDRQVISDWRAGRKPAPPEEMAVLAHLAGLNPQEWLVRGTLAKHEGTPKGERLLSALGKVLLATGGVTGSGIAGASQACCDVLRCIVLLTYYPYPSRPPKAVFLRL